jgi:hypothetical protein
MMASLVSSGAAVDNKSVTWTGWFSDSQCATARAKSGVFTPTNPDCARKCIENGSAVVFISEQAQALYTVKGYASAVDDLGYRLEIQASIDNGAKILTVHSAKRLEYKGASCARPKAKVAK